MKILAIAPQPFFTPRGTPFSVYYRTMVTAELGHEIDLLTYGQGQDVEIPGVKIIRIPAFNLFGEIKIGPSALKLFLDAFLVLWTISLLLRKKYDLVHAHEEAIFFCSFLKPIFRFKLIYDMHSSLPQQLDNFQFSRSKHLTLIFRMLEKMAIEKSDVIITICPDLAHYVGSIISDNSKHVMIENSIFEQVNLKNNQKKAVLENSTLTDSETLVEWAQKNPYVVYAGTLESYQGIDILIDSFKRVITEEPSARMLIMGGSAEQVNFYTQRAASIGINGAVLFTGRVPQKIAQKLTRSAQVQVSPRRSGTNTPLKIYEQLANGVPLVATNIYSHTQAIDSRVAFMVDPTPAGMASGILEALKCESKRKQKVNEALSLYGRTYSRAAYKKKLKAVLHRVQHLPTVIPADGISIKDSYADH